MGSIVPTPYDDMNRFIEAMQCVGFTEKQQNMIYGVVAAILHGGNVILMNNSNKNICVKPGMDLNATNQWLTHRVFKSGMREIITKTLSAESAQYGRDALLKFVYEKMFSWIVCLINKALGILNSCPFINLSNYKLNQ